MQYLSGNTTQGSSNKNCLVDNAKIYLIEIDVELKIYENGNLKNTKIFKERFNYNNSSNKFQLKQYEKNIQSNLINEIIKGITLYLYSI